MRDSTLELSWCILKHPTNWSLLCTIEYVQYSNRLLWIVYYTTNHCYTIYYELWCAPLPDEESPARNMFEGRLSDTFVRGRSGEKLGLLSLSLELSWPMGSSVNCREKKNAGYSPIRSIAVSRVTYCVTINSSARGRGLTQFMIISFWAQSLETHHVLNKDNHSRENSGTRSTPINFEELGPPPGRYPIVSAYPIAWPAVGLFSLFWVTKEPLRRELCRMILNYSQPRYVLDSSESLLGIHCAPPIARSLGMVICFMRIE